MIKSSEIGSSETELLNTGGIGTVVVGMDQAVRTLCPNPEEYPLYHGDEVENDVLPYLNGLDYEYALRA